MSSSSIALVTTRGVWLTSLVFVKGLCGTVQWWGPEIALLDSPGAGAGRGWLAYFTVLHGAPVNVDHTLLNRLSSVFPHVNISYVITLTASLLSHLYHGFPVVTYSSRFWWLKKKHGKSKQNFFQTFSHFLCTRLKFSSRKTSNSEIHCIHPVTHSLHKSGILVGIT